jgi:hypothetical protein
MGAYGSSSRLHELATLGSFTISRRWRYDWASIEASLGVRLPEEYKEFVQAFPPGGFGELVVLHPARRAGFVGLPDEIHGFAERYGGPLEVELPSVRQAVPFGFYPEPGGLIPWADFNADAALFWLPDSGDPDTWPVVAYTDTPAYEYVDGTTLEALLRVLRGEAGRTVFPEELFVQSHAYCVTPADAVELGDPIDE